MMRGRLWLMMVMLVGFLPGCNQKEEAPKRKQEVPLESRSRVVMWVAPQQVDCFSSDTAMCYQVRFEGSPANVWENLAYPISGLDFEPGYLYKLDVEVDSSVAGGAFLVDFKVQRILEKRPDPWRGFMADGNFTYKAIGFDPDWKLVIHENGMVTVERVGYPKVTSRRLTPRLKGMAQQWEFATKEVSSVVLTVYPQACKDRATGRTHSTYSELSIGDLHYKGCGDFFRPGVLDEPTPIPDPVPDTIIPGFDSAWINNYFLLRQLDSLSRRDSIYGADTSRLHSPMNGEEWYEGVPVDPSWQRFDTTSMPQKMQQEEEIRWDQMDHDFEEPVHQDRREYEVPDRPEWEDIRDLPDPRKETPEFDPTKGIVIPDRPREQPELRKSEPKPREEHRLDVQPSREMERTSPRQEERQGETKQLEKLTIPPLNKNSGG